MSLNNLWEQIIQSESKEENKRETSYYLNVANNILNDAENSGYDTTHMKKEYEDVRNEIKDAIQNDLKITKQEISDIKKEVSEMFELNVKLEKQKFADTMVKINASKIPDNFKHNLSFWLSKDYDSYMQWPKTKQLKIKFNNLLNLVSQSVEKWENFSQNDIEWITTTSDEIFDLSLKAEKSQRMNEAIRYINYWNRSPEQIQQVRDLMVNINNAPISEYEKPYIMKVFVNVIKNMNGYMNQGIYNETIDWEFQNIISAIKNTITNKTTFSQEYDADYPKINAPINNILKVVNKVRLENSKNDSIIQLKWLLTEKNINTSNNPEFINSCIWYINNWTTTPKQIGEFINVFQKRGINVETIPDIINVSFNNIMDKNTISHMDINTLELILSTFKDKVQWINFETNQEELKILITNADITSKLIKLNDNWSTHNFQQIINASDFNFIRNTNAYINNFPKIKDTIVDINYWPGNPRINILNKDILAYIQDVKVIRKVHEFCHEIANASADKHSEIVDKYSNYDFLQQFNTSDTILFLNSINFGWKFNNKKPQLFKVTQQILDHSKKRFESYGIELDLSNSQNKIDKNDLKNGIEKTYGRMDESQLDKWIKFLNKDTNIKPSYIKIWNNEIDNKPIKESKEQNKNEVIKNPKVRKMAEDIKWAWKDKVQIIDWKLIIKGEFKFWDGWVLKMDKNGNLNVVSSLWYTKSFSQNLEQAWESMLNFKEKMEFMNKIWFGYFKDNLAPMFTLIKEKYGGLIPWASSLLNIDTTSDNFLDQPSLNVLWDIFYKLWFLDSPSDTTYSERPNVLDPTKIPSRIARSKFYSEKSSQLEEWMFHEAIMSAYS